MAAPLLPTELRIDGIDWTVVETDHIDDDGVCDSTNTRILIQEKLSDGFKLSALWHEVIHSFFRTRDWKPGDDGWDEEQIATHLGPALHAFIKANCSIKWKN